MKIIIASGPVLVRDKKVLLNKSGDDNFWKFCGGKTEPGENLQEKAIRESKEELGVDINITNRYPFLMYVPKPEDKKIEVILVHFLADFEGDVVSGDDVKEWAWLDIDSLPSDIAPNIVPTLKYFGFL